MIKLDSFDNFSLDKQTYKGLRSKTDGCFVFCAFDSKVVSDEMVRFWEVEDRSIRKPYLGGWRHKDTGTEYLNAASQTGPRPDRLPWIEKCTREIQTAEMRDKAVQAPRTVSTQTYRPDYFIDSRKDKYMTAKPYESYDEMQIRLDYEGNARIIQRNYRVYRLLKYLSECAAKYRRLLASCRRRDEERVVMYRERYRQEVVRKTYPRTREDFDALYSLISQWREDCRKRTDARFFRPGRRADDLVVLAKTIEMLNVLERHKLPIREVRRRKKRVKFITDNVKPVQWHGYRGKLVEMVTMKTQKARELKTIYDSLSGYDVTLEERIAFLIALKKSLEAHNCLVAFNVIALLDQEIMLLSRGMEGLVLDCLRQRIIHAYLMFVGAAGCCACDNPKELRRISDCENLREPMQRKTLMCRGCAKLLHYTKFAAHSRMIKTPYCISCTTLRERSFGQVNYDPYMYLLNCVRAEERRRYCYSALAFMMQREDVYHLVNTIWRGRSIVSENSDLFDLRIIRYRRNEEWAPWNCIVLTDEEAEIHRRISDYSAVYSRHLLHKIFLAHQAAKFYFERLAAMETTFRESSRFYMIQDRFDYQPPVIDEDGNLCFAPATE